MVELIERRAPNVRVIRTRSGGVTLQIRGPSSPSGNNEPLLIIDGSHVGENGIASALAAINPADVDGIEVLTDAQSTSFYGRRAANGVILITTKRRE